MPVPLPSRIPHHRIGLTFTPDGATGKDRIEAAVPVAFLIRRLGWWRHAERFEDFARICHHQERAGVKSSSEVKCVSVGRVSALCRVPTGSFRRSDAISYGCRTLAGRRTPVSASPASHTPGVAAP
jgi:hypothetical protein